MSTDNGTRTTGWWPSPGIKRESLPTSRPPCTCRGGNVMIDPTEEGWVHIEGSAWRTREGAVHHLFTGKLLRPCKVCNEVKVD